VRPRMGGAGGGCGERWWLAVLKSASALVSTVGRM
jgi:hypothetical protein